MARERQAKLPMIRSWPWTVTMRIKGEERKKENNEGKKERSASFVYRIWFSNRNNE